jgi:hypothetical protein
MQIARIEDINKLEPNANPFILTGIEPWFLQSLTDIQLKKLLRDYKHKFLGKYHHPDLFQDPAEKAKHELYFKRASVAVDMLLSDSSLRRYALKNYHPENEVQTQERKTQRKEKQLTEQRERTSKLEKSLETERQRSRNTMMLQRDLKEAERDLVLDEKSVPLSARKSYKVEYVGFYDDNLFFSNELSEIYSDGALSVGEINALGEKVSKSFFRGQCSTEKDGRIRGRKRLIQGATIGGGEFDRFASTEQITGNLVGTLSWSALKNYLQHYDIGIITGQDLNYDALMVEKKNLRSHLYERAPSHQPSALYDRLLPFTAPVLHPHMLALIEDRDRKDTTYRLILPKSVKQARGRN